MRKKTIRHHLRGAANITVKTFNGKKAVCKIIVDAGCNNVITKESMALYYGGL
ncbi:hypothetical protein AALC75_17830 [Lachnospiraceae bacterium 48-42]